MPTNTQAFIALVIGVMIGSLFFIPLNTAVAENTGVQTVTNESITAETGSYVALEESNLVEDSETVLWLNSTSGSYETVSSPGDYTMNYSAGSIRAEAAGSITDGDELLVTYDQRATDSTTTFIASFIPLLYAVMLLAIPALYVEKEL